jgi:hypothetical protein
LVAAGGFGGEESLESGLAVDGQVEVAGDDQDTLAGQAAVDGDDVVRLQPMWPALWIG